MELAKREMITVPIDSIFEDKKNTRKHGKKNLDVIKSSYKDNNQIDPLTIQKSTRMIIGGNGRHAVMKQLGFTEVNVIELDCSDAEAKAISIVLNRSGDLAEWHDTLLQETLEELKNLKFDLSNLGFEKKDLEPKKEKDGIDIPDQKFEILVKFDNEMEQSSFYDEMNHRGIECVIL